MPLPPLASPLTSTGTLSGTRRAVPQLASPVIPPALDAAAVDCVHQCTGVNLAGPSRRSPPLAGPLTSTGTPAKVRRAICQLAAVVVPPALDAAAVDCVHHRTGVGSAGRDAAHPARQPDHVHRGSAPVRRAVPQLAEPVGSPALDCRRRPSPHRCGHRRPPRRSPAPQPAHVHRGRAPLRRAVPHWPLLLPPST